MLNRSYIIESQTAWLILSHKGYLEVNFNSKQLQQTQDPQRAGREKEHQK